MAQRHVFQRLAEEEPLMPRSDDSNTERTGAAPAQATGERRAHEEFGDTVEKRVRRVDSLTVYEVTDDELTQLEEGSPDSTMWTLAIFCFGAGISLLPTFFAATYASVVMQAVFACVTVVAFLAGAILTVLWWAFRRSRAATFAKIRKRGAENEASRVRVAPKARVENRAVPMQNEATLEEAAAEEAEGAERAERGRK